MSRRFSITFQPMSKKPIGKFWLFKIDLRCRNLAKRQSKFFKWRIGIPQSAYTAKIRQTTIHTHSSSGSNQNTIRSADKFNGVIKIIFHNSSLFVFSFYAQNFIKNCDKMCRTHFKFLPKAPLPIQAQEFLLCQFALHQNAI